jgi:hypothetical protein
MNAKDSTDRRAKTVQVFGCIWETQSIQNGQIKFSSNVFLIHTVLRSFGNPHGRTAPTILFPFLLDLMFFFRVENRETMPCQFIFPILFHLIDVPPTFPARIYFSRLLGAITLPLEPVEEYTMKGKDRQRCLFWGGAGGWTTVGGLWRKANLVLLDSTNLRSAEVIVTKDTTVSQ